MRDDPMTQWTLGEFEILLQPTPERLLDVDKVLAKSIEEVVRAQLEESFADTFEYMYVASVDHVDYQETPTSESREGGPTRKTRRTRGNSNSSNRQLGPDSRTVVAFNGGVVAFDGTLTVQDDITSIVKSAIETDLKDVLVSKGGPWALIESVAFTNLAITTEAPVPDPTSSPTTQAPEVLEEDEIPPTAAPTTAERTVAPPTGGISGIQEQDTQTGDTGLSNSAATMPQIVGGLFGVAFVLLGAILLVRQAKRRSQLHQLSEALSQAELDSDEDGLAPELRAHTSKYRDEDSTNNNSNMGVAADHSFVTDDTAPDYDDDGCDRSEMAQYAPGELLDSISVGPASSVASWEVNDDGATTRSLANSSSCQSPTPSIMHGMMPPHAAAERVAAMAYASNETFERDRLVALQKDLLQSDWTHDPVPRPGGEGSASIATTFARPKNNGVGGSQTTLSSSSSSGSSSNNISSSFSMRSKKKKMMMMNQPQQHHQHSISFAQAHHDDNDDGQGEEIYLMPPSRNRQQSDGSDKIV